MKNCGDSNWKIISHFDLYFKKDVLGLIKARINEKVALISTHDTGICAINKDAYDQVSTGFNSFTGFFAVPLRNGNGYKIRHGSDPRCTNKSIRIEGFDVCELLELNLWAKQWEVGQISQDELNNYFYHIGAGSGYHDNNNIAKSQRSRAERYLKRFNIRPIL